MALGGAVLAPAASAAPPCTELAAIVSAEPNVISATSAILGTNPPRCEVVLTVPEAINIRVGLPLSAADGGTGGVQGAWNGKVQNQGGGGYAGSLGGVTGPVAAGFVGSATDTGHSSAWCTAGNSQPNCGLAGGGFVLDADGNLVESRVTDFIRRSLHEQTRWALNLANKYYGMKPARNYWVGCSTGGRQGFEMAQHYGHLFDGFLVGAPAFNWNRFIIGEMWPPVAANDLLGAGGLSTAKSAAANAAAVAACDADDGVADGIISEPRRCSFNANALLCTGSPDDPATCLTPQEANAVNAIWDGPRNQRGERLWGGVVKGASFNTLLPGGVNPGGLILTYLVNWMHEDPAYDWRQISMAGFGEQFQLSSRKFRNLAATDDPNLDKVRKRGGKIIHYHGIADPLIVPYGSYNYVSRVFDRYGVGQTQSFMRSFFYPGVGHCAGGAAPQPNTTALFNVLMDWVENGVAPAHIVASQNLGGGATRTRKVCKYPDEAVYTGGDSNAESSFVCAVNAQEPADLKAESQTAKMYFEAP
jgi:feruloyl esterase